MASPLKDLKILEAYNYRAKLPFPQRPNGILSEEKRGRRYVIGYKNKSCVCDLSPFPGLTKDTLEYAVRIFESLFKDNLYEVENYLNSHDYTDLISLKEKTLSNASVEFALFQLWHQLSPSGPPLSQILTNDVLSFKSFKDYDLAQSSANSTLKVKCSMADIPHLLQDLKVKKENFPEVFETLKLRIDGNTSWRPLDLQSFWTKLKEMNLFSCIDYFEEPLENFQEYKKLLDNKTPIAHEEFLNEYLVQLKSEVSHHSNSQAPQRTLVIKPSQWSLSSLLELKSSHKGLRIVLSSAFELPEALNALFFLASEMAPHETHGLGAKIIESDIFREN